MLSDSDRDSLRAVWQACRELGYSIDQAEALNERTEEIMLRFRKADAINAQDPSIIFPEQEAVA